MRSSREGVESSSADPKDWVDKLFDSYTAQGYRVHNVVPIPPVQPTRRVVNAGQQYDYYCVPLPMPDEDEARARQYNDMICGLRDAYGEGNVVTAFPTDEILQAYPGVERDTHLVVMVRDQEAMAA